MHSEQEWSEFVQHTRALVEGHVAYDAARKQFDPIDSAYRGAAINMIAFVAEAEEKFTHEDELNALHEVAEQMGLDYDTAEEFEPYRKLAAQRLRSTVSSTSNLN